MAPFLLLYSFITLVNSQDIFNNNERKSGCRNTLYLEDKIEDLQEQNGYLKDREAALQKDLDNKNKLIKQLQAQVQECNHPATTDTTLKVTTPETSNMCFDHKGKEFILMFIPNFVLPSSENIELLFTSNDRATEVELVSTIPGISRNLSVVNRGTNITITREFIANVNEIESKGLYIKSTRPISVHGLSIMKPSCCTSGGFTALPYEMLGTNYIVVTYHVSNWAQIGLVAAHDNTNVTLTFDSTSSGTVEFRGNTYRNGESMSLSLSRLDTLLIRSTVDLTGTKINSNKEIAVLSGNDYAVLGSDAEFFVEMMPPVNQWGRMFVVPRISPANKMILRIVPSELDVTIQINNNRVVTSYQTNNTLEVNLPSLNMTFVYCSKPCLVVEFCADSSFNPFMVVVPSTEQFSNHYVLQTPTVKQFDNYISITIETRYVHGLLYDGQTISGDIQTMTDRNNTQWSSITMAITNGSSVISHVSDHIHFGLVQYGYGTSEAYAFPVGLGFKC